MKAEDVLLMHLGDLLRELPVDVGYFGGLAVRRRGSLEFEDVLADIHCKETMVEFVLYKGKGSTYFDLVSRYSENLGDPDLGRRLAEHIKGVC
jgi:hypothetical protein